MPVKIRRVKGKKCYSVTTPNKTHAKCTSKKRAEAQARLLRAVENSDWRPTLRKRVMKKYS